MTLDRLSGVLIAGFGAVLLVWIIPWQTETVDYGLLRPKTLPDIVAVTLVLLGLVQAVRPGDRMRIDWRALARAALYLGYAALSVWLMDRLGFVWVAPVMMLALMLWLGERRPLWLAVGTVAVPGTVWLVVTALERSLPG